MLKSLYKLYKCLVSITINKDEMEIFERKEIII